MKKKNLTRVLCCFMLLAAVQPLGAKLMAQDDENIKTGWTFGALPAVSYNSDLGFQYGALVNFYYFGDGTSYPKYMHSLYGEVSRYTKGSGINRFFYDSEYLIPNIRVTADISYLTEKALDFYGFNGYDAVYNAAWEDSDDTENYESRMFYRHERNMFRFMTDFQGKLSGNKLRWVAGFGILNNTIAPVDIEALNKGKDEGDLLPDVPGLYDLYSDWGIINEKEKTGGWTNNIKFGLVYDTRDFEPNPMKGMWSEVVLFTAPKFLGNGDFGFTKISATHRQYFTLAKEKLSFAYRLNYQGTIAGTAPFYVQPYMINSFSNTSNTDGLGGSKTLRGVLRNRVVGDAFAFGNAELRWKFYRTVVFRQNLYLGLNLFSDFGQVIKKIDVDESKIPVAMREDFYDKDAESLHTTLGLGLRIVLNENFIVAVDYGRPFNERDGGGGLYIGLNYLF
jgi:outer membrane protein assembly factor BamA